jgi:hypothetical protein
MLPVVMNSYRSPFLDDFSNTTSGWPSGQNNAVAVGYYTDESKNSVYRMLTKQAAVTRFRTGRADLTAGDLQVQVDATAYQKNGSLGIIFGSSGSGLYVYEIWGATKSDGTPIGTYHLLACPSGGSCRQIIGNDASETTFWVSSKLNPGNQKNVIGVIRQGSNIKLLANGYVIAEKVDASFGSGTVDLITTNYEAGFDARFDNFRLAYSSSDFPVPPSASAATATGSSGILSTLLRLWANDGGTNTSSEVAVSAPPVADDLAGIVPIER